MNPNFNFDAEGVFDQPVKPLRLKRSKRARWRKHWIVLTKGTSLDSRAVKQTMRGPKLLKAAMPRVIPKNPQRPRSAESEIGLKWERPHKNNGNVDWRETGEPERVPDKYLFNAVQIDPIEHTADVKKPVLIRAGSVLGNLSDEVTRLIERRKDFTTRPKIRTS